MKQYLYELISRLSVEPINHTFNPYLADSVVAYVQDRRQHPLDSIRELSCFPPESVDEILLRMCPRMRPSLLFQLEKSRKKAAIRKQSALRSAAIPGPRTVLGYWYQDPSSGVMVRSGESPYLNPALAGRSVGVEVEYYGTRADDRQIAETYVVHTGTDGSLKNGGREARIRAFQPAALRSRLELIRNQIERFDSKCGLHIHVDVRNHPHVFLREKIPRIQEEMLRILATPLRKLIPPSRQNNRYCRFRAGGLEDRYCAINFCSLVSHGTIEIRCQGPLCRSDWAPGENWVERVMAWTMLCQHVVHRVLSGQWSGSGGSWGNFLRNIPPHLAQWCLWRRMIQLQTDRGREIADAARASHGITWTDPAAPRPSSALIA